MKPKWLFMAVLLFAFCMSAYGVEVIVPQISDVDLLAVHAGLRDALNAQDADQVASYFLDDAVYDFVAEPPPMEGKEAIAEFFAETFLGLPDFHVEQRQRLASGNILITECTVTGTHLGELYQIPATGNSIQTMHLDVFEFEGDKIKHLTTYDNAASWLLQFGVMPVPEPFELVPSFTLPDPEATGLTPVEAAENAMVVWNAHDLETYAKLLHSDAEFLLAPLGVPLDRDALIASQELYFLQYSDMHVEPTSIIDMGDGWVATPCVWTGTNDGPVIGFPGVITGKSLDLRGIWLSRYDADGLMTNMNVYWDDLTAQMQLGLFPPPPDPEDIARRDFEEIWNQGNLDVVDEIVAPDIVIHVPPEPDIVGAEAYKGMVAMYRIAFPDMQWIIEDTTAQGDMVALRLTATGTHQGEFMGIPPTGVQVTGTMIAIVRVVDGKQVEAWNYADFLGFMQQLGVITPGRPAPENYMWGTPSEVTGDPGSPAANEALITRLIDEFWNQGNLDTASEIFSEDLVSHNPPISAMYTSTVDGLKQYAADVSAAFPDFQVVLDDLILEGDRALGHWTATGTHEGEFLGIPATGRPASVPGVTIYRFADNKIVEMWWAWDAMGLMQKLTAQIIPEGLTVDQITSPSLTGNLLGDPDTREVIVYLPPSYDAGGKFPVVYLLHGYTGNARTFVSRAFTGLYWPAEADFPEDGLYGLLNNLIASGALEEMIVVMPDGSNKYGGSFYTNSELTGNYEDYIVNDLVSYIDSNYRTIPSRDGRAIMGHSMGGYGAMKLAMKHPDVFGAVAVHGAPLYFEAMKPMMALAVEENPDGMIGPHPERPLTSIAYAMSAAFSPNLSTPPFFVDLPFEYPSPEAVDEVWNKWLEHDPFTMLNTYGANLASLKGVYLDSGYQDEFGVAFHAEAFHQALDAAGIKHEYEIYAGAHFDRLFEKLAVSLKFISDALAAEKVKDYTNVFFTPLDQGLNMISLPLEPRFPYDARSFAEMLGATMVVRYDSDIGDFVAFIPYAPDDGFPIEGGQGYIVNVPKAAVIPFTGAAWTNDPPYELAPPVKRTNAWAFVVGGWVLDGEGMSASDGEYTVTVKNLRTGAVTDETVGESGYFAAAYADLSRKAVVEAGDKVEVAVMNSSGEVVSGPFIHDVTLDGIRDAVVKVQLRLGDIIPEKSALLQNYPNPFNPETWIPFHLKGEASVSIRIFSLSGQLIRTLELGHIDAGVYVSRTKSAYWDGKNEAGEEVSSGIYFYSISAGDFSATKKMIIRK